MDRALKVERVVVINASSEVVWKALTDRETIKKYFFGTEAISDWKVGSSLIFQGEWEGKTYRDKGTILAVDAEKLLQYNYWSRFSGLEDVPENYSLVTYRMTSEGNQTTLTLTQEGFAGEEAKVHAEGGWARSKSLITVP